MAKTSIRNTIPQPTSKRTELVLAATYTRISWDLHDGAGVGRQDVDTDQLANRHGWTIVERIVDNDRGASRYSRKAREGWDGLIAKLESGEINAVIVYDLDRLTRQPKELEQLIDFAEDDAIQIVSMMGVIDLSTSHGRFAARQQCAMAAHETDRMSERQRRKLIADAEQGIPHWPRRPFGYAMPVRSGHDLTIDTVPAEAAFIREAYDRAIDGQSATSIAVWLNECGSTTAMGAPWQSASVKFLLTSPRNAGLREYKGEVVGEGAWPAIVDMDTVRAATAALEARATGPRTKGGKVRMLTRLVKCGLCGQTMQRTGGQYRCFPHDDYKRLGCGQATTADRVDDEVERQMFALLGERSTKRAPRKGSTGQAQATLVTELRGELDELGAMFGRGEISMSTLKAASEPLRARLTAAERSMAQTDAERALARVMGEGATLQERWTDLDDEHKHRIMRTIISEVRIVRPRPEFKGRACFDPERVQIDFTM